MYLALALLMLAAISCGSPEPVEPTPTPDVPLFAAGEAEALVEAVVYARWSVAESNKASHCVSLITAVRALRFGTTTASYLGQQVWSVVSDPVKYRDNATTTLEWKVFEFSGVVQGTNESAENALSCG